MEEAVNSRFAPNDRGKSRQVHRVFPIFYESRIAGVSTYGLTERS